MGDRANVFTKAEYGDDRKENRGIYFYTHWQGSELPVTLQSALIRGRDRWSDGSYLNRIIFCEMVESDPMGNTGFGISTTLGDNEHPILVVDSGAKKVYLAKEGDEKSGPYTHEWTFEEYVNLDLSDGFSEDDD